MDWDAFGAIGEWLGAIGVVVTLAFLVAQVRQNGLLMRRIEMNTTQQEFSAIRRMLIADPELIRTWIDGAQQPGSLTAVEQARLGQAYYELFWTYWQMWERARVGLVESGHWSRLAPFVGGLLQTPFGRTWWQEGKAQFPPDFVAAIDRLGSSAAS